LPGERGQTRPTMGSTAVYAQKQQVFFHCPISPIGAKWPSLCKNQLRPI
jgi:hypothetical protein